MMRIPYIDFMRYRIVTIVASGLMVIISIAALSVNGLQLAIDFTGGVVVEVSYPEPQALADVRDDLTRAGFVDADVSHFGTPREVLVRLSPQHSESYQAIGEQVHAALLARDTRVELRRTEFVGPQVGQELAADGLLAMLFVLIAILVYVTFRFAYRLSIGAVAALVHDALITLGLFALFGWTFDLTVLAALLAVIGYSLNDTIVVFDRIRENFVASRTADSITVVNDSLNQTLTRTVMTSFATLLVVVALLFFGGEVIHNFALALSIGIVVGTYSSIYVASNLSLWCGMRREQFLRASVEEEDDGLP